MDKKAELQFCKEVITWLGISRDALETQLAEAEKPELRHGDIRLWNPSGDIGIVDMSEPNPHMIWESHDLRNAKNKDNILSQSKSIGTLQEIFDDLKALSEPLTEFFLGPQLFSVDDGNIRTAGCIYQTDRIRIFIDDLRRLLHTAEQAKNDS